MLLKTFNYLFLVRLYCFKQACRAPVDQNKIMKKILFTKMHGLGNDFVIIDARERDCPLTPAEICRIADRHHGIGFDQLIRLELPTSTDANIFMRIFNADGSESGACGNAARCVAARLMTEMGEKTATIETISGILDAWYVRKNLVAVNMGVAHSKWDKIPLSEAVDTLHLDISVGPLKDPVAVNIGNPHAVFFVKNVDHIALEKYGYKVENHPLYPERTNVEIVQVLSRDCLRVKVWERGCGITLASGSCAAAALVGANRRGLVDKKASVIMDGGALELEWGSNNCVIQIGPYAEVFSGTLLFEELETKL